MEFISVQFSPPPQNAHQPQAPGVINYSRMQHQQKCCIWTLSLASYFLRIRLPQTVNKSFSIYRWVAQKLADQQSLPDILGSNSQQDVIIAIHLLLSGKLATLLSPTGDITSLSGYQGVCFFFGTPFCRLKLVFWNFFSVFSFCLKTDGFGHKLIAKNFNWN